MNLQQQKLSIVTQLICRQPDSNWIYNSRNYLQLLNKDIILDKVSIYNSRNYLQLLNENQHHILDQSTTVEIIYSYSTTSLQFSGVYLQQQKLSIVTQPCNNSPNFSYLQQQKLSIVTQRYIPRKILSIYNSRNYLQLLNLAVLTRQTFIYNSRNYLQLLNVKPYNVNLVLSTTVEIIIVTQPIIQPQ